MQGSGARDAGVFAMGVAVPALVLSGALVVAAGVAAREPAGTTLSLATAAGLAAAAALDLMRRRALATGPSRGRACVAALRGLVRLVALAALPVNALVIAGLATRCYGRACGVIPMVLLDFTLTWCLMCLACVPFGYRLLGRAAWLQPRRPHPVTRSRTAP